METMPSLRGRLPAPPLAAGRLAAMLFPAGLRAEAVPTARAQAAGIAVLTLIPALGDFNDNLRRLGAAALAAALRVQLDPVDVTRFWQPPDPDGRSQCTEFGAAAGVFGAIVLAGRKLLP